MYYVYIGKGMEQYPHTQTAVNNFLGMHNYDAMMQIKVGAWVSRGYVMNRARPFRAEAITSVRARAPHA